MGLHSAFHLRISGVLPLAGWGGEGWFWGQSCDRRARAVLHPAHPLEAELFISRKSELTKGRAQKKEGRDAVGCAHPMRFPQIHRGAGGPQRPVEMLRHTAPSPGRSRLVPVSTENLKRGYNYP